MVARGRGDRFTQDVFRSLPDPEQALIRIGLDPEPRKFAPHVTLARLRDPALDKLAEFLAANAQFRAPPLPVEHFSLIASFLTKAGSIYEDQADYPLSG